MEGEESYIWLWLDCVNKGKLELARVKLVEFEGGEDGNFGTHNPLKRRVF